VSARTTKATDGTTDSNSDGAAPTTEGTPDDLDRVTHGAGEGSGEDAGDDLREGTGEVTSGRITPVERLFFLSVALLALWVGSFGAFAPRSVDWALPWLVPPLHARFLGAMYLSGAVFMIGATVARRWSAIRVVVPMCAIWTGLLLLVSLLHLPEFDWRKQQVWIWFGAYLVFPAGAALIAWRRRHDRSNSPGPSLPPWLRAYLVGQAVVVLPLAGALLLFPAAVAPVWPWPITPLLAHLYSAPFFSFGLGALLATRQRALADVRLYVLATFVFAAGVLVASVVHRALFSTADLSDWLWFYAFVYATLALGAATLQAFRPTPPARRLARPKSEVRRPTSQVEPAGGSGQGGVGDVGPGTWDLGPGT
jgi:hypothetical protein